MHVRGFAQAAAVLASACASNTLDAPGYPLYAGATLPREQVVHVYGSLASVDGRDVSSLGSAFELLAGCHVVLTRSEAVASTTEISVVGSIGARYFALHTQPGYSYFFRRETVGDLRTTYGGSMSAIVFADERDSSGASRQTIHPAQNRADLVACLHGGAVAN